MLRVRLAMDAPRELEKYGGLVRLPVLNRPVPRIGGPHAKPNKPMVRTATTALAEPARNLGRPHIGQPLDRPRLT